MAAFKKTLLTIVVLAFVLLVPTVLLVLGSPIYEIRSFNQFIETFSDAPSSADVISLVLHAVVWVGWLSLLRITVVEWISPTETAGLGSRILRRFFVATGALAISVNSTELQPVTQVAIESVSEPARSGYIGQPVKEPEFTSHAVQVGESWLSLADRYMGDPSAWQYVRSLNMNKVVADGETVSVKTHIIKPGWNLRVPIPATNSSGEFVRAIDADGAFERQASLILSGLGVAGSLLAAEVVEAIRLKRRRRNVLRSDGKFISDLGIRPSGSEAAINHLASTKQPRVLTTNVSIDKTEWPNNVPYSGELQLLISKDRAIDLGRSKRLVVGGGDVSCGQFFNSAILQIALTKMPLQLLVSPACKQIVANFEQVREIDSNELQNLMTEDKPNSARDGAMVLLSSSVELMPYQRDYELLAKKNLYLLEWDPTSDADVDIQLDGAGDISLVSSFETEPAQMVTKEAAESVCKLLKTVEDSQVRDIRSPGSQSWDKCMLRVLGRIELLASMKLTNRQLSLVTYLVVNGPSSRSQLKEALWDGQRVSDKTFSNLVSETRSVLGRQLFPTASQGRYQIIGVTSDLDRLRELIRLGADATNDQLKAGLELATGTPFSVDSRTNWSWISYHSHIYAEAEACIVDVASELSFRLLVADDFYGAIEALKLGLKAVQTDEKLISRLVEVCENFGKKATADRIRRSWLSSTGHSLREDIFRARPSGLPDALDSDYAQAAP